MTLDENLQLLEDWTRRLKIEYDIFFAGAVRKPPYDLRNRVDSLIKRIAEERRMTFAQRYRYNTLAARYASYRDLWRRLVQDKELGVLPESLAKAAKAPPSGADTKAAAGADASSTQSFKVQISDPLHDMSKVHDLYDFLVAAQSQLGEKKILPFDNFCSLVQSQTAKIKETKQCQYVTFNISVEDDKVKFTAKADPT